MRSDADRTGITEQFSLDPGVVHLNHGAYGTVPRRVQQAQHRLRLAAEADPHRFHKVVGPRQVAEARGSAADFLGLDPDEVVLMRNVTEAIASVLASLDLREDDELVVSNHGYGALRLSGQGWCDRTGARLVTANVPLDARPADAVAAHEAVFSSRTRLVVIDQVTSPTGMVLPVPAIASAARRHGAAVFVDAAHVPGHIEAQPATSGADFWVGNLHKWAFAARGTAAVWVAEDWRDRLHPLVTGWNHGHPFPLPFDARGTDDYTAWMCLPEALRTWSDLGGWTIPKRNADLVDRGLELLADALDVSLDGMPRCPAPALRLLPLPAGMAEDDLAAERLYEQLSQQHRIESAVLSWAGRGFVRLTAQLYNRPGDYQRLADALRAIIGRPPTLGGQA